MATEMRYRDPLSTQTLREALAEYHVLHPNLLQSDALSDSSAELFTNHDLIHVVFGLDTTLHDETLADTWTIFGASISFWNYLKYVKNPDVMQVLQNITADEKVNYLTIAQETLRALPDVLRVIIRSRRMSKKWPWHEYQAYWDKPLNQIRHEFGIQVIAPVSPSNHQPETMPSLSTDS